MTRYWWVNQGVSYREERNAGILWAPKLTQNGRRQRHWESMTEVAIGDRILHYADQEVKTISVATSAAIDYLRPESLPTKLWADEGRLVRTDYHETEKPVHREEIPLEWRLRELGDGPFQIDGEVKVGYLFPLTEEFGQAFLASYGDRYDPVASTATPPAPPEATEGASNLLRRLVGEELHTLTGRRNRVLSVGKDEAIVSTSRSPHGQPVPVQDVQAALNELISAGEIEIRPETVGYRSAFIGAVLLTLPGVIVDPEQPQTLRLTEQTDLGEEQEEGRTFEGDLSPHRAVETRGEQTRLRRLLLGASSAAECALCGKTYPVQFIVAAHIKKRSACTEEERRDLSHVGMPVCLFGCDALFEEGFIAVEEGTIVTVEDTRPELGEHLTRLRGRVCRAHTAESASYFAWHRKNVYRGIGTEEGQPLR